jgi:hypothetical protein
MEMPKSKRNRKEEVLKSLSPEFHPIFEQLVADYQFHALEKFRARFVSYYILGELIKDGWRPTHPLRPNLSLGEKIE